MTTISTRSRKVDGAHVRLQSNEIATPAKFAEARRIAPEANPSDLEQLRNGVIVDRATGAQFRIFNGDVFGEPDKAALNISMFFIDAGGRLRWLRARGHRDVRHSVRVCSTSMPTRRTAGTGLRWCTKHGRLRR